MTERTPWFVPGPAVERVGVRERVTIPRERPRGVILAFLMGATPSATGVDAQTLGVPFNPRDGTFLQFRVLRVLFRVETVGTTASRIALEKSCGAGKFEAQTVVQIELPASEYEHAIANLPTVLRSGDKLRANVVQIGTTSAKWLLQVEIGEVAREDP